MWLSEDGLSDELEFAASFILVLSTETHSGEQGPCTGAHWMSKRDSEGQDTRDEGHERKVSVT